MDKIMNYMEAQKKVTEHGWDAFLKDFQEEYKDYGLYACSTPWIHDKNYICKIRGTKGDILIGWKGIHDND